MPRYLAIIRLWLLSFSIIFVTGAPDSRFGYRELLQVNLVDHGDTELVFKFSNVANVSSSTNDYNLFPLPIGSLAKIGNVKNLRLSLTQGRTSFTSGLTAFKTKCKNSTKECTVRPNNAPVGVELQVTFDKYREHSITKSWERLLSMFSGISCASLQLLDPQMTIYVDGNTVYGALPHEGVCTENFAPWVKLLPCRAESGFASAVQSTKLFQNKFHSFVFDLTKTCDGDFCLLQLTQTLITLVKGRTDSPFKFSDYFESFSACPSAYSSAIAFSNSHTMPQQSANVHLFSKKIHDNPTFEENEKKNNLFAGNIEFILDSHQTSLINLSSNQRYNFAISPQSKKAKQDYDKSLIANSWCLSNVTQNYSDISITKSLLGHEDHRGKIKVQITNPNKFAADYSYFDFFPYFIRPFFSTLKVYSQSLITNKISQKQIDMTISPSHEKYPGFIKFEETLAGETALFLEIDYETVFLHFTISNHRFDIPSAILTVKLPNETHNEFSSFDFCPKFDEFQYFSQSFLIELPQPDYTMPYNIIMLTCAFSYLFFGSFFNPMFQRMNILLEGTYVPSSNLERIILFVKKVWKKKSEEKEKEKEKEKRD